MNKSYSFCTLLLLFNYCIAENIQPRRDEEYPPKNVINMLKPVHKTCVEKTGVTEESIKEFSDGDIHEDPALKCYMNCFFHEIEVVDDNGELHIDKLRSMIPDSFKDIVENMINKCSTKPEGDTLCEKAWWFHQCWKKVDPKHYFII